MVSGKGSCYDKDGRLIYRGMFANDKPVGKYPMKRSDGVRFGAVEYSDGDIYIGELDDGGRYGMGIYIWKNGSCLYAKWDDDGTPEGMEVYISPSGVIADPPDVLEFSLD